jgi:hypothetical protein
MNKFRPMLQISPSQRERLLLASSQLDVPPPNAKKRALAVFGISGAIVATTQLTGAASAAAATSTGLATAAAATGTGAVAAKGATTGFALALLKGLAIGAVTGTVAYTSLTVHRAHNEAATSSNAQAAALVRARLDRGNAPARAAEETPAVVPIHESEPSPVAVSLPSTEDVTAPAAIDKAKPVRAAPPPEFTKSPGNTAGTTQPAGTASDHGQPKTTADLNESTPSVESAPNEKQPSLRSERAAIEQAQAQVHRGDPTAALRTLAELQRQVPKPQLAPEAMLVRIEALLKLGRLSEAQRLGSQFLASQPDGPYAQRVRSLLNAATTR